MLKNLFKAVVSVAVTPIAVVVDTAMIPFDACDHQKGAFTRTGNLLKNANDCVNEAIKPEKK